MIKGVSLDMLQRYVEMRKKIDSEVKTIYSLANMLSLLQHCADDRLEIDVDALGYLQSLIEQSILNIWEWLDDFIYLVEARGIIEKE